MIWPGCFLLGGVRILNLAFSFWCFLVVVVVGLRAGQFANMDTSLPAGPSLGVSVNQLTNGVPVLSGRPLETSQTLYTALFLKFALRIIRPDRCTSWCIDHFDTWVDRRLAKYGSLCIGQLEPYPTGSQESAKTTAILHYYEMSAMDGRRAS
ncbi:hypothetical protein EDC01DRAFT_477803 [Geopyxis carbonaria]|nr:hypothetical protein EDC01DRAFT_477803 [Geopyxis carbonaria]